MAESGTNNRVVTVSPSLDTADCCPSAPDHTRYSANGPQTMSSEVVRQIEDPSSIRDAFSLAISRLREAFPR